jgi:hypothetical protein
MSVVLSALLIFLMRLADVSLGTLRIVMLVRGRRSMAGALGFFESLIWTLAAAQVLSELDEPLKIIGYAGGFATVLNGEGRDGPVRISFSILPRRQAPDALALVAEANPFAIATIEDASVLDLSARKPMALRK